MAEFSYEIMAAVLIVAFLVLLCGEYIWLYVISKKNEESDLQKREINARIHGMLEAFLYSPTASTREAELSSLVDYIGDDPVKRDEAAVQFVQLMGRAEDIPDENFRRWGCCTRSWIRWGFIPNRWKRAIVIRKATRRDV